MRRFRCWGAAMLGIVAMSLVPIAYRLLPVRGPEDAWTLGQSAVGLASAVAMALAFASGRRAALASAAGARRRAT